MTNRAFALPLLLASLTLVATSADTAHAQLADPYVAAKVTLGLGGSAKASVESNGTTASREQDLEVSFGLAGQYVYPLHDYFSLGGMLGLQSWRSTADGDGGRNLVFDLAVLPQGKYVVLPGKLELSLGLPIGVALDFWNEVDVTNTWVRFASGAAPGGQWEGDTALGFVVGLMLGARYQAWDELGLLLELGYLYRTFGHEISVSTTGGLFPTSLSTDVTVSTGQLAVNLGVYF